MPNKGYVYLILLREFKGKQENIFKFGCTKDIIRRFADYPRGSILLACHYVDEYQFKEQEILATLRDNFIQCKDIGREYFQGKATNILTTITDCLRMPFQNVYEEDEETNDNKYYNKNSYVTDPELIIQAFMEKHKHKFNQQILKSKDVYDLFCMWMRTNEYTKYISHKRFTTGIKNAYGVKTKPYRFDDGISQATIFGDLIHSIDIANTTRNIASEHDHLIQTFIDEMCVLDEHGKISTTAFILSYNKKLVNHEPIDKTILAALMKTKGFEKRKRRINGNPIACFLGLGWKSNL